MADHGEVLAICVNWNGKSVLAQTLRSLLSSSYPRLRIVVVDNASADQSPQLIPSECEVIRLDENKGYGAAINRALQDTALGRHDHGPAYYLILNNDVLLDTDAVSSLVSCAEQHGPGIYGPKILQVEQPDRLDMAWGELTYSHVLASFRGKGAKDAPEWNSSRQVSLLQGSVLLVSPQVLATTGGFDEAYFMYHEEVDFEVRARAGGFHCHYCPAARVWHHSGHSTRQDPARRVFWTRRNTVYFLRKYRVSADKWAFFFATLFLSLLYNLATIRIGRVRTIIRAVGAGFRMPVKAEQAEPMLKGAPAKRNG